MFSRFPFDDFSSAFGDDFYSPWTHSPRICSVHPRYFHARRRTAKPNRSNLQMDAELFPRSGNSVRTKKPFIPREKSPVNETIDEEEFLEATKDEQTTHVPSVDAMSNQIPAGKESRVSGKSPQHKSCPVHGRGGKRRSETKDRKGSPRSPNSFESEPTDVASSEGEGDAGSTRQEHEPKESSEMDQQPTTPTTNDLNTETSEQVLESPNECEDTEKAMADEKVRLIQVQVGEARELAPRVEAFCGNAKERLYLEEHLTRCLLELDKVEANGSSRVKSSRKSAIREIDSLLNDLDTR